ncbi:MAG: glycosyltransferase [Xanthomonadales bacterium]|nr:glycosyltransferase [Xanthomonadales bacterium]
MTSIALLIPARNAATTLPDLLGSARGQAPPFDEVLCFDDASGDETAEVARSLGAAVIQADKRVGAGAARNRLAERSRCEWIHFHDADDLLLPAHNAMVHELMTPGVDVVVAGSIWEEQFTGRKVMEWQYRDAELVADPLLSVLSNPVGGISATLRRSVFESVNGFDERRSCWEDADLHVRLAAAGARYRAVEQPLTKAIRRDGSLSADQDHCRRCRLEYLAGYRELVDSRHLDAVALEAARLMENAFRGGDKEVAREAMVLASQLGLSLPDTQNPWLRAVGRISPFGASWLQARWRRPRDPVRNR